MTDTRTNEQLLRAAHTAWRHYYDFEVPHDGDHAALVGFKNIAMDLDAIILARMSAVLISVPHPLNYGHLYPAHVVLSDLAAQEGCDGEPYDTMQDVADKLRAALSEGTSHE